MPFFIHTFHCAFVVLKPGKADRVVCPAAHFIMRTWPSNEHS